MYLPLKNAIELVVAAETSISLTVFLSYAVEQMMENEVEKVGCLWVLYRIDQVVYSALTPRLKNRRVL